MANLKTQRKTLRVLDVDAMLLDCLGDLEKYVSEDGVFQKALRHLMQAPTQAAEKDWRIEGVCKHVKISKKMLSTLPATT